MSHWFLSRSKEQPRIAVLGLGYVGCVTAACLAHLGYRVHGLDPDDTKIQSLQRARAPFYEPGLQEIIEAAVSAGLLSAGTAIGPALDEADVALICVGTPSTQNGNVCIAQLERVVADIECSVRKRAKPLIVAVRSTVFPGTTETITASLAAHPCVHVVSNPEFLREGAAVKDFLEPSLIVVGGSDASAVETVAGLYEPLGAKPYQVSVRTAEAIKYCCNAFHAVKITFANEIGTIAGDIGVSAAEVMELLCKDTRLNIAPAYLKPGFAFGGSCLAKDVRALTRYAVETGLELPLLQSILPSNQRHIDRAVRQILEHPGRAGIFGLAFKEDTDDLRESAVVSALEQLIGKGKDVRVYDPRVRLDCIYGSNRHFLLNALPHISKLLTQDLDDLLQWADFIVIAQKPAREQAHYIANCGKPVIDLVEMR